ncbi:MAG: XRE family transcriptional regulator [Lentimicrobiaceae bacterium]|nr:XRE family transcriptional regulator [Lentimicrobiaceae bacterium]
MKKEHQCIGDLIKEKLMEQGRSVRWLAIKIGYTPSNIYKTLKYEYIHSELIVRISNVLEYNFFTYYSDRLNLDKSETMGG